MAKIRKVGIPSGGTTGQVLKKTTGSDYDTEWGTGGAGATDFTDLGDVPSSYVGQATKVVRVNAGETALEFATISGSGDVVGPASATSGAVVLYDGATGKLIKNSTILPTTVGIAISNLANPSAVTFIRINADNTVTARTAAEMLSDIGAQAAGSYLTAANIVATITNGVTTNAPSEDAVFDALALKQDTLVSATNIKTINGTTILGSGDLVVSGGDMLLGTIQTVTAAKIFNSGTLKLKDTTFDLIVASDSGTTVDRTLTLDVNNNDRRITIGGDTTLNGGTHNGFNTGDQTISNSSDSTSHTVTLSSSGGSLQLIEGTNITLTTGGTGLVGTVTISASGGGSGASLGIVVAQRIGFIR